MINLDHSLTHGIFLKDYNYYSTNQIKAAAYLQLLYKNMCERLRGCDIILTACNNYDHLLSVAKVIMTIKKGQEELDQFTLTRSEYAKELGITPNAVSDAALKKSLENTEKKNKESFTPLKDYGGPVAMRRVSYPIDREDYNPPAPIRKPFRGYDWVGSDDDGSVEIDLSRSNYRSGVSHGEPQFKSKVSEAIWRLKNKK